MYWRNFDEYKIIYTFNWKKDINCNGFCYNYRTNKCCLLVHVMGKKGINCIFQNCKCNKDCLLKGNN